jgi:hypothetical protein
MSEKDRREVMTAAPDRVRRCRRWRIAAGLLLTAGALIACQPKVQVEAPKEPITINLNIKLDADVRVRLEERAKEDIQHNPDIF